MWWDVSTRGTHTGRFAQSNLRCMVGCHSRTGHPSTGASLALLAVYAIVIPCFLRLVLRFLLAGLFLIRPVLLSFRTRHGARFFHSLRILSILSSVPRSQSRGPGRSVVLIGGCWATVKLTFSPLHPSQRRVFRPRLHTAPVAATGYAFPKRRLPCEPIIVHKNAC